MDYTAREEDESSATGQLRHYVGVFDPETKALQVVEARNMNVRGTLRSEQQDIHTASEKELPQACLPVLGLGLGLSSSSSSSSEDNTAHANSTL